MTPSERDHPKPAADPGSTRARGAVAVTASSEATTSDTQTSRPPPTGTAGTIDAVGAVGAPSTDGTVAMPDSRGGTSWASDPAFVAAELQRARARTLALVDLTEDDQRAQHSVLMSPLVWDLAHIGNYEELWLLRALDGRPALDPTLDDLYNAFEHPRWERPSLPILGPAEARAYDAAVREQVLELSLIHI